LTSAQPCLYVSGGPFNGRRVLMTGANGELMLGWGPTAQFQLDGLNVEHEHARVRWDENGVFVDDVSQKHETFVNGDPFEGSRSLSDGDRIWLGKPGDHDSVRVMVSLPGHPRDYAEHSETAEPAAEAFAPEAEAFAPAAEAFAPRPKHSLPRPKHRRGEAPAEAEAPPPAAEAPAPAEGQWGALDDNEELMTTDPRRSRRPRRRSRRRRRFARSPAPDRSPSWRLTRRHTSHSMRLHPARARRRRCIGAWSRSPRSRARSWSGSRPRYSARWASCGTRARRRRPGVAHVVAAQGRAGPDGPDHRHGLRNQAGRQRRDVRRQAGDDHRRDRHAALGDRAPGAARRRQVPAPRAREGPRSETRTRSSSASTWGRRCRASSPTSRCLATS
jgi:hypothetical protein